VELLVLDGDGLGVADGVGVAGIPTTLTCAARSGRVLTTERVTKNPSTPASSRTRIAGRTSGLS
jgi:hypothetical protein